MKRESQPIKNISPGELMAEAEEYQRQGYRLVQACCTKLAEDSFEVTYSFDKNCKFENIRITVPQEIEIPSISPLFGAAFLYENEMHELFGISFKGMSIDFKGHLYKKKIRYPFSAESKEDKSCQK